MPGIENKHNYIENLDKVIKQTNLTHNRHVTSPRIRKGHQSEIPNMGTRQRHPT